MLGLIYLLILLSVALLILSISPSQRQEEVSSRLRRMRQPDEQPADNPDASASARSIAGWFEKALGALKPWALRLLTPKQETDLEKRLISAGLYDRTPITFIARRLLMALVVPLLLVVLNTTIFSFEWMRIGMLLPFAALLGYFLPLFDLNNRLAARQNAIFRSLPDMIDLLTICVEAGISLNAALSVVTDKLRSGPLRDELDRLLKEVQLGKPRLDALRDLGTRVGLKELTSFTIALIQSEQMGVSLSKSLRIQSDLIRQARWNRAQEMAQKAPVKMVFPIALLIFPVIFLIIFGPMLVRYLTGQI